MRREPYESDGQQVFRHLQAIVAWHAAATSLLDKNRRRVAPTLRVGLVEVSPSQPDLMTDEEVIEEFFRRRPASSSEARIFIENFIRKNHTKKKFTGTTHAEATLMGLLTYFSPGSPSVNHGDQIEDVSLRLLKELIEPVCCLLLPFLPLHTSNKILGYRQYLRKPSLLVKSAVGAVTGLVASLVILSCPAHMGFYSLGLLLEWELMSLFSMHLRTIYGTK
jgi:hypothetical protein